MTLNKDLIRRLGALLVALVGVMNIVSALYPAIHTRVELLREIVPLHLIRGGQTATVLAGFFLILLADGLRKRRHRAMLIAVALLVLSAFFNVIKGLDIEEATVALLIAGGLVWFRHAFDIPSRAPQPSHLFQHLATFGALYYGYLLAGFFILRRSISPVPTFWGAALEPFRFLADRPQYEYLTPHALWFERSLAFLACLAALYAFVELLRPLVPKKASTREEWERVRELVQRYGSDTLSYFGLQNGRSYFFDSSGEAFLSYRLWGNTALVAGDPIGRPDRIGPLLRSFLDYARTSGIEPCFVGVKGRGVQEYGRAGLKTLKIGEEAIIDLQSFEEAGLKRKVRRAARHIAEVGIEAQVLRRCEMPSHLLNQMEEISGEWVRCRGGEERGFSMTLGRLPSQEDADCEVMVATQGDYLWGYLCLVPVYQGNAWSLDAMRRRPDSPNGLTEFLIIRAATAYGERGYDELSLNFATLSNAENDIPSRAIEGTRRFLFEHLSAFYQLDSLYHFNSKFQPRWQSRYLAYRDVLKIPKLALAIAQSEDPIKMPSLGTFFGR